MTFADVLQEHNIKIYEIIDPERKSIIFSSADDFIAFLSDTGVKYVFAVKRYTTLEDTLIKDDILNYPDDYSEDLVKDIKQYNSLCKKVDYTIPIKIDYIVIVDCVGFQYSEETNSLFYQYGLGDPEDKLDEIIERHEDFKETYEAHLEEIKRKEKEAIEAEKVIFEELIFKNERFSYCTNKNSRIVFLEEFLQDSMVLEKCPHLVAKYTPTWKYRIELQTMIDMIWIRYKDYCNQRK